MNEGLYPIISLDRFVGRAKTISVMDVHYAPPDPYGKEIEAVDSILPGEVVVISTGENRWVSEKCALG